jgi:hypothetical protein
MWAPISYGRSHLTSSLSSLPNAATGNPGAAALTPNSDVMFEFQRNWLEATVLRITGSIIRDLSQFTCTHTRTAAQIYSKNLFVESCGQRQQRRRRRHRRPWFRMDDGSARLCESGASQRRVDGQSKTSAPFVQLQRWSHRVTHQWFNPESLKRNFQSFSACLVHSTWDN